MIKWSAQVSRPAERRDPRSSVSRALRLARARLAHGQFRSRRALNIVESRRVLKFKSNRPRDAAGHDEPFRALHLIQKMNALAADQAPAVGRLFSRS
jgi:hypothetical protein